MDGAPESVLTESRDVDRLADRARKDRLVAVDLEFVSEGRYVPELALVQLGFPLDEDDVEVYAVDPLAVDVTPLVEALTDPDVEVVAHAARQDLSLLFAHFGAVVNRLFDTQLAAAFAGLGEQLGYARLVRQQLDIELDKGPQWTDWTRRPLKPEQLRYALDDVRYLLTLRRQLSKILDRGDRIGWVHEESDRLCAQAATRKEPELAYRNVGGAGGLKGAALGSLRALAAWREREAVSVNKPPSWLLPDNAMVDLCRRNAKSDRDLKRARGVGAGTVRRYGDVILDAIEDGGKEPPTVDAPRRQLSPRGQAYVGVIVGLIHARCTEAKLPSRFAGSRSDAEMLVRFSEGEDVPSEEVVMLNGWRHGVVGAEALAWLRGENALVADPGTSAGLRLVPVPEK